MCTLRCPNRLVSIIVFWALLDAGPDWSAFTLYVGPYRSAFTLLHQRPPHRLKQVGIYKLHRPQQFILRRSTGWHLHVMPDQTGRHHAHVYNQICYAGPDWSAFTNQAGPNCRLLHFTRKSLTPVLTGRHLQIQLVQTVAGIYTSLYKQSPSAGPDWSAFTNPAGPDFRH